MKELEVVPWCARLSTCILAAKSVQCALRHKTLGSLKIQEEVS